MSCVTSAVELPEQCASVHGCPSVLVPVVTQVVTHGMGLGVDARAVLLIGDREVTRSRPSQDLVPLREDLNRSPEAAPLGLTDRLHRRENPPLHDEVIDLLPSIHAVMLQEDCQLGNRVESRQPGVVPAGRGHTHDPAKLYDGPLLADVDRCIGHGSGTDLSEAEA
jgi:hypothetical protein